MDLHLVLIKMMREGRNGSKKICNMDYNEKNTDLGGQDQDRFKRKQIRSKIGNWRECVTRRV